MVDKCMEKMSVTERIIPVLIEKRGGMVWEVFNREVEHETS